MFTIDEDRNIQWTDGEPDSDVAAFSTLNQLQAIADARGWSKSDVTAIWNTFAGVAPFQDCRDLKQFRNRPYGLQAIWKAIQRLREPEAAPDAATQQPEAEKPAPVKRAKAPKAEKKPRKAKPVEEFSGALKAVLDLISRKTGASIAEIMERLGWTATHTVRGRISILGRKGVTIESSKDEKRGRVYRAA